MYGEPQLARGRTPPVSAHPTHGARPIPSYWQPNRLSAGDRPSSVCTRVRSARRRW